MHTIRRQKGNRWDVVFRLSHTITPEVIAEDLPFGLASRLVSFLNGGADAALTIEEFQKLEKQNA